MLVVAEKSEVNVVTPSLMRITLNNEPDQGSPEDE